MGIIRDQENQEPIPYAHVKILNTYSGTITNQNGEFTLYSDETSLNLHISVIGYEPYNTVVTSKRIASILLKKGKIYLQELVFTSKNQEKELLINAINAIGKNYPNSPEYQIGFFRETLSSDSTGTNVYYVSEAELTLLKSSYSTPTRHGIVKMNQGRKVLTAGYDTLLTRIIAGPHLPHRFDHVMRRDGPLRLRNIDDYNLQISDTTIYEDSNLFEMHFQHKKNGQHGILYILDNSFAIVKVIRFESSTSKFFLKYKGRIYYYSDSEYDILNGSWRLSAIKYRTGFINNANSVYLSSDYTLTNISEDSLDFHIPYSEQIGFSDNFESTIPSYDPEFWTGFHSIQPDSTIERLFLSNPQSNKNFKKTYLQALKRIECKYSLFFASVKSNIESVTYQIHSHSHIEDEFIYGTNSQINFQINSFISVGYENKQSLFSKKLRSNSLVSTLNIPLNTKEHPFFLNLALKGGLQKNRKEVFVMDDASSTLGSQFNSETTKGYLETRTTIASPSLGLEYCFSKFLSFTAAVSYNAPFWQKNGIYFTENKGLFRNKKFVAESHSDIEIVSSGKAYLFNYYDFSLGISLSL